MAAKRQTLCENTIAELVAEKTEDGTNRRKGDACPYCIFVIGAHHQSHDGGGVESNPGPCSGGVDRCHMVDLSTGVAVQCGCGSFASTEEQKSCEACHHHANFHYPDTAPPAAAAAKRSRAEEGAEEEETRDTKRAKRRLSIIDDHGAAVYIAIGQGFCNGTLITYHTKLFVWTTAHALVDTSQTALPLFPKIELRLTRNTERGALPLQRLAWTRAHHSYGQFDWRGEAAIEAAAEATAGVPDRLAVEATRCFDALIFELDEMHNELADRARTVGHRHDTVTGRTYKPSQLHPGSLVAENIHDRIHLRKSHLPLGYTFHQALRGSSGTGLIDRYRQLQGVIAASMDYKGAPRSLLLLPAAFTQLLQKAVEHSDQVVTYPNPNLEADQAAASEAGRGPPSC